MSYSATLRNYFYYCFLFEISKNTDRKHFRITISGFEPGIKNLLYSILQDIRTLLSYYCAAYLPSRKADFWRNEGIGSVDRDSSPERGRSDEDPHTVQL
jgi:hypothetical protein